MLTVTTVRFDLDRGQIEALATEDYTVKAMKRAGYGMAKMAALAAPRKTGRGANSIRGLVSSQPGAGPADVDVAWGRRHYHMTFQEAGWVPGGPESGRPRVPGRYFLANAFENYIYT